LRVCSFGVGVFQRQVTGSLELMPAVAEHVRGNPNDPERNSSHKDD
jgi:hypothetical protein